MNNIDDLLPPAPVVVHSYTKSAPMAHQSPVKKADEPTSILDLFGEAIVAIEIGKGEKVKRFLVHKALLCTRVPYFNAIFNGSFKEGIDQKASFPEDDIDAWALLIDWVYQTKVIPLSSGPTTQMKQAIHTVDLIKAYSLAQKHIIDQFADQLMGCISDKYKRSKQRSSLEATTLAYNFSRPGSRLRLYYARDNAEDFYFTEKGLDGRMVKSAITTVEDLAVDVLFIIHEFVSAASKTLDRLYAYKYPKCDYHRHPSDMSSP